MLGKQLWRCDLEPNSLWRRIIQGKYRDIKEGLVHLKVREAFGVGLWKAIRRGWEEFSLRTHILECNNSLTYGWGRHFQDWVRDCEVIYGLIHKDRPSTKVHAAPGGGSSLGYLFGGGGN
ncbi:hypothetical protein CK203_070259 [Vitis vinifera]|uniref:Uncharacterized protein n=1 Tax=Vitis vinifera TaxID=29760 RepID=A0A438E6J8_VITVI|nr:hypothetical protein CK203_070259 [Vitis vinifera]